MLSSTISLSMAYSVYKIFFLILLCFWACNAAATDTLNQGDEFNSSASLVSINGLFTLRFFPSISPKGSINGWYLGIWLQGDNDNEPCWVANRKTPIPDDSGVLIIDDTGTLTISYSGGDPIKLFSSQSKTNVAAVLRDDGNFVLQEAISDGTTEQPLWQSFDFPTDSLLPGMKLGINHNTGQNWSLTSWLTNSLPSPGAFTLEWYPSEEELIIKRRGVDFWTSGRWVCGDFDNVDVFTSTASYIFSRYLDNDGKYLNYKVAPNLCNLEDRVTVSRLWLWSDGNLVDQVTKGFIFAAEICDGNTTDWGCKRWEGPACRHGAKFERRTVFNNDPKIRAFDNRTNLSLSDCKDMCWKDCNCVGVQGQGPNPDGSGCTFLSGPLKEMENGPIETFYIIIPAPSAKKEPIWKWILISIAVAATLIVTLFLGNFLFIRWRRLRLEEKFLFELMSEAKELEIDGKKGVNLKVYSVSSIMDATNSFSSENKLGEGGFGAVYKGLLADGQEIAIKRLSVRSSQGLVEFKNELIIVAKLQHMTLVRLLGFCIQGEEKILVYEYMPNKSLDSYIFDSKREMFDWNKYLNIIKEIAQGLLYLHKYSRLTVIHRDLKAGNILLDKNMNPKISDFGMAKICSTTESDAYTNRIVGTRGYMAPEYARGGIFSTKSDVFSFGVLMLEIISGRRSNNIFEFDEPLNLIGYAWKLWKEGAALELMQPTLRDSCSEDQVLRCINVALLCVEHNPVDRPSMSVVISMLASDVVKLSMPKQPAFSFERRIVDQENSRQTEADNCTKNNLTISVLDPR